MHDPKDMDAAPSWPFLTPTEPPKRKKKRDNSFLFEDCTATASVRLFPSASVPDGFPFAIYWTRRGSWTAGSKPAESRQGSGKKVYIQQVVD
jgi:hypothetical protein